MSATGSATCSSVPSLLRRRCACAIAASVLAPDDGPSPAANQAHAVRVRNDQHRDQAGPASSQLRRQPQTWRPTDTRDETRRPDLQRVLADVGLVAATTLLAPVSTSGRRGAARRWPPVAGGHPACSGADHCPAHEPLNCGLDSSGLMLVPPKRATSGVPYSAAPPKLCVVVPGITLPKFQAQVVR
jgi:hypothetical protein